MPTLYVENVPVDLYEALRERARSHRKSIASEVISLLEENVPVTSELHRRAQLLKSVRRIRGKGSAQPGAFSSAEDMLREDRSR